MFSLCSISSLRTAILFLAGWLAFQTVEAKASDKVDFNFQIRPILSDRCFKCHGFDSKSRKADLRLDTPESAYALLKGSKTERAIVRGRPEKSDVFKRITSTDPDEQMPPPNSNLHLNKAEIELLKKWIEQGAEYNSHWAFVPVKKPAVPKTKKLLSKNAIDQFVFARLLRENVKPSSEAAKETLIRRLSLSLTGLPPSLEKIEAFLQDTSPNAYDKMVDHFLASPAYGERMANDWLDLARYADTYGYQSDVDCDLSAWRDWVIRAFNENLSYDDFIAWQIAGDLLPNATDEQILATAFNRLHRQTNEGGSIEEEFRAEYNADRVHTFGTAFLGLTLECARCHDHKYDPITQRDYYRFFAFFNNIDESGLYSHFTQATPTPTLLLYGEGQKVKHAELKLQLAEQELALAKTEKAAWKRFEKWRRQAGLPSDPQQLFTFDQITNGQTANVLGTNLASLVESPQPAEGRVGGALQFDGENSAVIKGAGNFKRTDEFTFSLWLKPTEQQDRAVVFHHSRSWTDAGSRGYELILEKGKPNFALVHFWPGNAISVRMREELPLQKWTHLIITYDGSSRASGIHIFQNGKAAEVEIVRDNLFKDILHRAEWGDSDVGNIDLTLAARFRDSGFKNGLIDEFAVFDRCLTPLEIQTFFGATAGQSTSIRSFKDHFTFYLSHHDPEYRTARAELEKLREVENAFVNDIREIMVMKEMSTRRPTFLLKRGAYDAPGEPVEPGTPERIFPFPKNYPPNRLGLAQWLVDRRNPLTARVVVNRIWKMHFGRGLVATPEDFGSQGSLPTHPELLDWLAATFVESGWDVKKLHKLIVTSATYRQSSVAAVELIAADPDNRLLARGPKMRLSAEAIRDSALAISGLLSRKVGGPSVKPYQPAGLWEQSGVYRGYDQAKGEGLYRRSLYTFWRRTAPPPTMLTFDATSREVCTAKRETTTTPLQALVLLNDPQFIEAARVLAEKLLAQNVKLSLQVEQAFRMVLGRSPLEREKEIGRRIFEEQLNLFTSNPEAADKFLAVGEKARDKNLAAPELAAMAVLVNTLMNHDEFVMKR